MWAILSLILCLLPTSVVAGSLALPRTAANSLTDPNTLVVNSLGTLPDELLTIILIGDPQNLSSETANQVPTIEDCSQSGGCTGIYCVDSIYCRDSWRHTNLRGLRNMAYSAAGQIPPVDWLDLDGMPIDTRTPRPRRTGHPQHGRPDLILVVGDNQDNGHTQSEAVAYGSLPAIIRKEMSNIWDNFYTILNTYNIPWMTARGNHDAPSAYSNYFNATYFSSLPGYFNGNDTSHQYARIFTMGNGRQICVVNIECAASAAEEAEANGWVGCGAGLPTIVLGHIITNFSGSHFSNISAGEAACDGGTAHTWNNIIDEAANAEIIMSVSGHFTLEVPQSSHANLVNPPTFAGGEDVLDTNVNWQEIGRYGNSNTPYGATSDDGAGMAYKVCTINWTTSVVGCYDYSPFFESKVSPDPSGFIYESYQGTYNPSLTTRFP